jgi:hypothetical protein
MAQKQKEAGGGGSRESREGGNFAEGRAAADAKRAERYVWPFFEFSSDRLVLPVCSAAETFCAQKRLRRKNGSPTKKRRTERRRKTICLRSF